VPGVGDAEQLAGGEQLWLPAIALKTPVFIKPGKDEPWTPFRLIQAFIAAGAPAEAFGFYPTDHEGSGEVVKLSGRSLVFGDVGTVKQYENNPARAGAWSGLVEDHHWRGQDRELADHLDVIVASIGQRRALLHQRLGGDRAEVWQRNRRCHRGAFGACGAAAAGG
jgi:hypothetical protein